VTGTKNKDKETYIWHNVFSYHVPIILKIELILHYFRWLEEVKIYIILTVY